MLIVPALHGILDHSGNWRAGEGQPETLMGRTRDAGGPGGTEMSGDFMGPG